MRGSFVHNQIMAGAIKDALYLKGYPVFEELPVRPGQRPQSIDVATRAHGSFILFEIERSVARVGNDIAKARKVGAGLLNIVVAHPRMRLRVESAVDRLLAESNGHSSPRVQVMTLGTALHWIANNCPVITASGCHNGRRGQHHTNHTSTKRN